MTDVATKTRADLPPLPWRMNRLPVDYRGFPVPWFVQWFKADGTKSNFGDGVPDFRVVDSRKIAIALRQRRCWVCGEPMGVHLSFVIGPMCAVTLTTSEPPNHSECGKFSACGCPFLSRPRMRRNEHGLPPERVLPGGIVLSRNPGVACLWTTRSFKLFRPQGGEPGTLFQLGPAEHVEWYAEGRPASRAEVITSIESGLPLLQADNGGPESVADLKRAYDLTEPWFPKA